MGLSQSVGLSEDVKRELLEIFKAKRDASDIFPLVEIPFEDGVFLAPHNSHAYLTKMFGDYMQLPQEVVVHGNIKFVN